MKICGLDFTSTSESSSKAQSPCSIWLGRVITASIVVSTITLVAALILKNMPVAKKAAIVLTVSLIAWTIHWYWNQSGHIEKKPDPAPTPPSSGKNSPRTPTGGKNDGNANKGTGGTSPELITPSSEDDTENDFDGVNDLSTILDFGDKLATRLKKFDQKTSLGTPNAQIIRQSNQSHRDASEFFDTPGNENSKAEFTSLNSNETSDDTIITESKKSQQTVIDLFATPVTESKNSVGTHEPVYPINLGSPGTDTLTQSKDSLKEAEDLFSTPQTYVSPTVLTESEKKKKEVEDLFGTPQ